MQVIQRQQQVENRLLTNLVVSQRRLAVHRQQRTARVGQFAVSLVGQRVVKRHASRERVQRAAIERGEPTRRSRRRRKHRGIAGVGEMDEREKMGVRFRLGEGALGGTGWDRRLGDVDRVLALRLGRGRRGRGGTLPAGEIDERRLARVRVVQRRPEKVHELLGGDLLAPRHRLGRVGDDEGTERVSEDEIAVWKKTSVSGATGRGA